MHIWVFELKYAILISGSALWQCRRCGGEKKWPMCKNTITGKAAHVPVMSFYRGFNRYPTSENGMWRHRTQWQRLNQADKRYPPSALPPRPRHSSVKVRSPGLSIKWHKHFAAEEPWCSYSAAAPVLIPAPFSFFCLLVFLYSLWVKWSWKLGWQVCLCETYHTNIVQLKKISLVWHVLRGHG